MKTLHLTLLLSTTVACSVAPSPEEVEDENPVTEQRISSLETDAGITADAVASNSTEIATLKAETASLREELDALKGQFGDLASTCEDLSARMGETEGQVEDLFEEISSIPQGLTASSYEVDCESEASRNAIYAAEGVMFMETYCVIATGVDPFNPPHLIRIHQVEDNETSFPGSYHTLYGNDLRYSYYSELPQDSGDMYITSTGDLTFMGEGVWQVTLIDETEYTAP